MPQNKYLTKSLEDVYDGKIDTRTAEEITEDIVKKAGLVITE